jgi:hypothetical protein
VKDGASTIALNESRFYLSFASWLTAIYAFLLAIVTMRHEMFRDEVQAWLIARDSTSIPNLIWNLRYEGHPALWHLLLFLPSHFSWNPVSMQVINYLLAVLEAWLILSEERLPRSERVLLAFSFFVFYGYGAIARNYMLAMLLLTAAARCQLGRQRYWLGIVLLALALNSHFFAIPIVAVLFVVLFCFPTRESWERPLELLRKAKFWIASTLLLSSLLIAYFTVRPQPDSYTPHYATKLPVFDYFLISLGRMWQFFAPFPEAFVPQGYRNLLLPRLFPSTFATVLSLILVFWIASALRSSRARVVFLSSVLLELIVFSITVRIPPVRHYGLLFCSLMIALMVDAHANAGTVRPWLGRRAATATIYFFLGLQAFATLPAVGLDLIRPFSEAKETALWIRNSNYSNNPIAIAPDIVGAGIVGYLQRDKVYYPECRCSRSFVLWNTARNPDRTITREELDGLSREAGKPAILIVNSPLDENGATRLGVHLLRAFDRQPMYAIESFYVYLHDYHASSPIESK